MLGAIHKLRNTILVNFQQPHPLVTFCNATLDTPTPKYENVSVNTPLHVPL